MGSRSSYFHECVGVWTGAVSNQSKWVESETAEEREVCEEEQVVATVLHTYAV